MSLFLCLSIISLDQYCRKSLAKSGGFGKMIKKETWPYRSGCLNLGFKPSAHYVYTLAFLSTLSKVKA